jgi:hypothetical protein
VKIRLLDVVALTHAIPEHNLRRGEVGTVVEILSNGDAFEVEFSDRNGQMYKSLSFFPSQLMVLHHEPMQKPSVSAHEEFEDDSLIDQKGNTSELKN